MPASTQRLLSLLSPTDTATLVRLSQVHSLLSLRNGTAGAVVDPPTPASGATGGGGSSSGVGSGSGPGSNSHSPPSAAGSPQESRMVPDDPRSLLQALAAWFDSMRTVSVGSTNALAPQPGSSGTGTRTQSGAAAAAALAAAAAPAGSSAPRTAAPSRDSRSERLVSSVAAAHGSSGGADSSSGGSDDTIPTAMPVGGVTDGGPPDVSSAPVVQVGTLLDEPVRAAPPLLGVRARASPPLLSSSGGRGLSEAAAPALGDALSFRAPRPVLPRATGAASSMVPAGPSATSLSGAAAFIAATEYEYVQPPRLPGMEGDARPVAGHGRAVSHSVPALPLVPLTPPLVLPEPLPPVRFLTMAVVIDDVKVSGDGWGLGEGAHAFTHIIVPRPPPPQSNRDLFARLLRRMGVGDVAVFGDGASALATAATWGAAGVGARLWFTDKEMPGMVGGRVGPEATRYCAKPFPPPLLPRDVVRMATRWHGRCDPCVPR